MQYIPNDNHIWDDWLGGYGVLGAFQFGVAVFWVDGM